MNQKSTRSEGFPAFNHEEILLIYTCKSMKGLSRSLAYLSAILFFLLPPIFWLPLTVDPFNWPKNALLVGLAMLLVLAWTVRLLSSGGALAVAKTPFTFPLILLAGSYIVSLFGAAVNSSSLSQVEAAVLPMGAGTIVAMTVVYLLLTGPLTKENRRLTALGALALAGGAVLAGAVSLISFFSIFPALPKPFVATGNFISLLPFLVVVLAGVLAHGWFSLAENGGQRVSALISVLVGLLLGLLVFGNIWKILPSFRAAFTFLPYPAGWQVAAETLKMSPLWGMGPTNFLTAFSLGRPVSLNADPALWNFGFFVSSNTPFHLLATVGIIGFLAYAILALLIVKTALSHFRQLSALGKGISVALLLTIAWQLLLPPTLVGWWVFFALLILLAMTLRSASSGEVEEIQIGTPVANFVGPAPGKGVRLGGIVAVVTIVALVPFLYFSARALAAELAFRRAMEAVTANNGGEAYNKLNEAIGLNPFIEAYHLSYGQVNLAVANSLAAKKDLNETDRTNITQLIQQAIREGKAAVAINQNKATNWENLTSIYRSLINFAQGADQWALAAARQAAILNPTDPNSRLNLGGIYYSLGDYDSAINFFQQAVLLKPDWANAHYNLAVALREKKGLGGAIAEMQTAISLVPAGSDDASRANGELKALQEAAEATKSGRVSPRPTSKPSPSPRAAQSTELEKPQPLPTPVLKPPLNLGTESGVPLPSPTP